MAVLGAGISWGFMGYFTRHLAQIGIGTDGAIIIRCIVAALGFALIMLINDPSGFKVKPKDFWCFFGSGILSFLFFTFCYFTAISMMSLSAAAILLYLAPSIVTVLSAVLFKEKITPLKAFCVLLSFSGCCLVSGIGGGVTVTFKGLLFGVGAGAGYALYTIFSRFALERGYSSVTINFYSCVLAGIGAVIIWHPMGMFPIAVSSAGNIVFCIMTGIVTCFVPYLLYTYGLTGLENGKASVIASIEPVVASLLGIVYFHEDMTLMMLAGIVMVLTAVVLLNRRPQDRKEEKA